MNPENGQKHPFLPIFTHKKAKKTPKISQKTTLLSKKRSKTPLLTLKTPILTLKPPKNAPPDEEKIDSPLMNLENGRIDRYH
jgi:hypothetical protein